MGRKEEAIECYNQAIKLNHDYFHAYYSKGNVLVDLGRNKVGIECNNQAIKLDPNYFDAYQKKGDALR